MQIIKNFYKLSRIFFNFLFIDDIVKRSHQINVFLPFTGTSLEAIRAVVASGKICVLNLHPQSLKLLRQSDLKPYTVLVAPPSLEKLRQKRIRAGEPYKVGRLIDRLLSWIITFVSIRQQEEELKEIIATARDMEARWGHLFDMIIINNDTERAYHQLLAEINSLEREPQWVEKK